MQRKDLVSEAMLSLGKGISTVKDLVSEMQKQGVISISADKMVSLVE